MAEPRRILMAKLGAAHGVRGLVKLGVFSANPEALNDYETFYTTATEDTQIALTVRPFGGNGWLAEIGGIGDRNAAEKLRGTELWVDRDRLPEPDNSDEYYIADLLGLAVQTEAGEAIGTIVAVDNFGAGDLLEIRPAGGKPFYVPFRKEYLVALDLAARRMTLTIPEEFRQETTAP